MPTRTTRRRFLTQIGAAAAGITLPWPKLLAEEPKPARRRARVVIARDEKLTRGKLADHKELLRKLLEASVQRLMDAPDATRAWRRLFRPEERIGIKVNCLGRHTQPAVVEALTASLCAAGIPAENIIIWDRFDSELQKVGFKLNKSGRGVQCRGTSTDGYEGGYQSKVENVGQVGSCFSKILAEDVDAIISVPVLKDHGLAGVSLGMKNFYGAIHNPNKYHPNHCNPYAADLVAHRFIAPRWRLTVCDGTLGQVHGGPRLRPAYEWRFGGLLVATDFVALDAVGADLIDKERRARGMDSLAEAGRPPRYIATAAARGLGEADLNKIERIEV